MLSEGTEDLCLSLQSETKPKLSARLLVMQDILPLKSNVRSDTRTSVPTVVGPTEGPNKDTEALSKCTKLESACLPLSRPSFGLNMPMRQQHCLPQQRNAMSPRRPLRQFFRRETRTELVEKLAHKVRTHDLLHVRREAEAFVGIAVNGSSLV
ncbi:MAG: hypothetical protein MHM6MM_006376 [Cercozoa sp. M6MM]